MVIRDLVVLDLAVLDVIKQDAMLGRPEDLAILDDEVGRCVLDLYSFRGSTGSIYQPILDDIGICCCASPRTTPFARVKAAFPLM